MFRDRQWVEFRGNITIVSKVLIVCFIKKEYYH